MGNDENNFEKQKYQGEDENDNFGLDCFPLETVKSRQDILRWQ